MRGNSYIQILPYCLYRRVEIVSLVWVIRSLVWCRSSRNFQPSVNEVGLTPQDEDQRGIPSLTGWVPPRDHGTCLGVCLLREPYANHLLTYIRTHLSTWLVTSGGTVTNSRGSWLLLVEFHSSTLPVLPSSLTPRLSFQVFLLCLLT